MPAFMPIATSPPGRDAPAEASMAREHGLLRQLTTGQQAMLAIGGAIGTGLFLGSGLAVNVAGPAVILSYVIGAVIAWTVGIALTEMSVAHPTAGSFGVHAEMYLSPFAGYAVRVSYWLMEVIATGGHMVAVSIYMQYWLPGVPAPVWIAVFALALVYLNTRAVGTFGGFEYWFAMVKVVAIAVFVVLAAGVLTGVVGDAAPGLTNYVAAGGFAPMGLAGIWMAACFALYSFIGVEAVAVASGEARQPAETIPRAFRRMLIGLSAMYLLTVTLLVGVLPWTAAGVSESPFVTVLRWSGVRGAASIMNFVVLTAALSGANANLYLITRTTFSLARAGFVPAALGAVNRRGTPANAVLVSGLGLAVPIVVRALWPDSAYAWFLGVALFGALFVWLMICLTHLAFRRASAAAGRALPVRGRFTPLTSAAAAAMILGVLISSWWVPDLKVTLLAGGPWLLLLAAGYRASRGAAATVATA
jgi:AAT family amino acid transporter